MTLPFSLNPFGTERIREVKHKFGTLYTGNVKQKFPVYPWIGFPGYAPQAGDIPAFNFGTIEIRDSDENDDYIIQWVQAKFAQKTIYICDRCILYNIPYSFLGIQGIVSGKQVMVDGENYILRLVDGGTEFRDVSNLWMGALPLNNEWDNIIANERRVSFLPIPTSIDINLGNEALKFDGVHNKFWNWITIHSLTPSSGRGNVSAQYMDFDIVGSGLGTGAGFRPVLERL
ncbi:MAG: hypothetical protein FWG61_00515 [Firmicutes bacterium]|nr:hypothetical protein [Bacillota bacterium]